MAFLVRNGSYGTYGIYYTAGGGHSLAWHKVDGEVVIIDSQINEAYTAKEFEEYYGDYVFAAQALRVDDKKLNTDSVYYQNAAYYYNTQDISDYYNNALYDMSEYVEPITTGIYDEEGNRTRPANRKDYYSFNGVNYYRIGDTVYRQDEDGVYRVYK